jgi:hypothetical protein
MRVRSLLLLAAGASIAFAQGTPVSDYAAKVMLLEKICRFVDWPARPNPGAERPFILAVVGRNPFGDELDAYFLSHKIKGRNVSVKYFRGPADIEICDLLFISSSEQARLTDILKFVAKSPALTIGDTKGYAAKGVMLNILRDGDHLGFEINISALKKAGLNVAPSFLGLAKVY